MTLEITLSVRHRAMTLVGLLAVASLALPSAGSGQTTEGERALLNKNNAPFVASDRTATPVIDGERALLGRRSPSAPPVAPPREGSRPSLGSAHRIDGERALLGKSFRPRSR